MLKASLPLKLAMLFSFVAIAIFASVQHTHAAKPPPSVTFTKVGESTGSNVVYFTIRVENNSPVIEDDGKSDTSEDNGTGPLLIQDFVPAGAYWYVLEATLNDGEGHLTDLECVTDAATISCNVRNVLGQHLNAKQSAFVHGSVEIVIYGVGNQCGKFHNVALLLGLGLPRTASADAEYPCPATPTPTLTPTATPTSPPPTSPPPTQTPVIIVATPTSTSTPIRIAPLPPNTGDSAPAEGSNAAVYLYVILGLGAITFGIAGATIAKRRC